MDVTRRKTLLATGGILGLAGCIADATGNINPNGDDNGDSPDEDDDSHGDDPDDVEHDVFQLGPSQAQPLWATVKGATGLVTRLDSADEEVWMVENPEDIEGLQSWLDETNFSHSTIVYVETAGPNTCYDEIGVSHIGIEDGEIVGNAEAIDTSGETRRAATPRHTPRRSSASAVTASPTRPRSSSSTAGVSPAKSPLMAAMPTRRTYPDTSARTVTPRSSKS